VHAAYGIAEDRGYDDRREGAHALPDELSSVPAGFGDDDPDVEDRSEGTPAPPDDGPES
jgi:hypothetical protein